MKNEMPPYESIPFLREKHRIEQIKEQEEIDFRNNKINIINNANNFKKMGMALKSKELSFLQIDIFDKEKKHKNYNLFCRSKKCPKYINWSNEYYSQVNAYFNPCYHSCKILGESENIDKYPNECPYKKEIEKIELSI